MDLNELKKKATDVGGDVMKKASEVGESVKTTTQNTLDAMKYNSAISDEERRIRIIKAELADKYLEMFKDENPHEELNIYLERIKESEKKIEENRQLLSELKVPESEPVEFSMPKAGELDVMTIVLGVLAIVQLLCWQCSGISIDAWLTKLSFTFAQAFNSASQLSAFFEEYGFLRIINPVFYLVVFANIGLCVYFLLLKRNANIKRIVPGVLHAVVALAVGIFMIVVKASDFGAYVHFTAGAYLLVISAFVGVGLGWYLYKNNK